MSDNRIVSVEVARFDVRNSDGTLDSRYVMYRDLSDDSAYVKVFVGENAAECRIWRQVRQFPDANEALAWAIVSVGWGMVEDYLPTARARQCMPDVETRT